MAIRPILAVGLLLAAAGAGRAEDPPGTVRFHVPSGGGWAMTPDGVTLIVSVPSTGELVFFDTVAGREARRLTLEFRPGGLALQGETLFVAVEGSGLVHALNVATGKSRRVYRLPGASIRGLACHPRRGPVFAANAQGQVLMLDPRRASWGATIATGTLLAVDPTRGAFLYTGDGGSGSAALRKYAIRPGGLQLVAGNDNAAVGADPALSLSPDGTRIALAAAGGRAVPGDPKAHYSIAVYSTRDLTTVLGEVELGPYPRNIAFHPVLDLAAAHRDDVELRLFAARSLVPRGTLKVDPREATFGWKLLAFGGRGTRLIYAHGGEIALIPLELTDEEKDRLANATPNPAAPPPRGGGPAR